MKVKHLAIGVFVALYSFTLAFSVFKDKAEIQIIIFMSIFIMIATILMAQLISFLSKNWDEVIFFTPSFRKTPPFATIRIFKDKNNNPYYAIELDFGLLYKKQYVILDNINLSMHKNEIGFHLKCTTCDYEEISNTFTTLKLMNNVKVK